MRKRSWPTTTRVSLSQAEIHQRLHASLAPGIGFRCHRGPDTLAAGEPGPRWCHAQRVARRAACSLPHAVLCTSSVVVFAMAGTQGYRCPMLPCHAPVLAPAVWPDHALKWDAPAAADRPLA